MRGRIGQRDGAWYYIVDVGRDAEGKRKREYRRFRTKRAAEAALNEVLGKVAEGSYVPPSRKTVAQFVDEWLDAIRPQVRPSTFESYRMNLRNHVLPHLGGIRLRALNTSRIKAWYGQLERHDGKGKLSARTIRYTRMILRKMLSDAVAWGEISRNPADAAKPPRVTAAPQMRTWSAEELRRFLQSVQGDRLHAAWLMLAMTGTRRGEVLGLRWEDVDVGTGQAAITQTLVVNDRGPEFSTPKSERGRRSLALDPATVAALKQHRKRQLEERVAWGAAYQDSGLVFTRENGSLIDPSWLSSTFRSRARAAKLPEIRLHDIRHTYATLSLQAGVHPKVVSERLGHSTIAITLDTYSHVIPSMQQEAADRVAALILG